MHACVDGDAGARGNVYYTAMCMDGSYIQHTVSSVEWSTRRVRMGAATVNVVVAKAK